MSALTLEHISHAYGAVRAVDDLGLSIESGELVCLVGPSGCGKTTALRVAAGLEVLQHGRVLIGGRVMADARVHVPPEARSVGLMFQDYALFPHLSVADNVAFGLRGRPGDERRKRVEATLARVGMMDEAKAYPHMLSGGQQQRVALARALAPEPRIMLLDEPFSGLDAQLRARIRDDTLHLLKSSGAATLMVTHDPEEAMFMADRIAVMRSGGIVQLGRPADLYYAPVDAFVAGFFGEVNRLDGRVADGRVRTPLGDVNAGALAEGTLVEVLIRPEALKLHSLPRCAPGPVGGEDDCAAARVMAARLLGRSSLVHLSVEGPDGAGGPDGGGLHLHARVPGRFLPDENELMAIHLDRSEAFVFPLPDAK